MFQSQRGQAFFKACSYLNTPQKQARSKQLTTEHMEAFLELMLENGPDLHTHSVALAEAAARLLQFAIHMIEMQSLLANCDHWADTLPRATHGPAVAAWKAEPDSQEHFSAALIEAFEGRLLSQRDEGTPLHDQYLRYTKSRKAPKQAAQAIASRDPYGSAVAQRASPLRGRASANGRHRRLIPEDSLGIEEKYIVTGLIENTYSELILIARNFIIACKKTSSNSTRTNSTIYDCFRR